jgi:hypothetical protein
VATLVVAPLLDCIHVLVSGSDYRRQANDELQAQIGRLVSFAACSGHITKTRAACQPSIRRSVLGSLSDLVGSGAIVFFQTSSTPV